MRRILLAFALLAAACQRSGGPSPNGVDGGREVAAAARVNGMDIPRADFEAALRHAERSLAEGEAAPPEIHAQLAERILDKMIQDELLVQHARSLGLEVKAGEVDYRLESIKQSGGGEQAYERFLADSALAPERVRLNLERNLLLEKLAARLRSELAPPDEAALRRAYEEHCRRLSEKESVVLAHILFSGPEDEARRRALRVQAEIRSGLDFTTAARRHSEDANTREVGGALGRLAPDDLQPELAAAVAALAEGAVSDPVRSSAGLHLLHLESRAAPPPDFDGLRSELERELQERRTRETLEALAARLARESRVERLDN